jgi:hypothetical protein
MLFPSVLYMNILLHFDFSITVCPLFTFPVTVHVLEWGNAIDIMSLYTNLQSECDFKHRWFSFSRDTVLNTGHTFVLIWYPRRQTRALQTQSDDLQTRNRHTDHGVTHHTVWRSWSHLCEHYSSFRLQWHTDRTKLLSFMSVFSPSTNSSKQMTDFHKTSH